MKSILSKAKLGTQLGGRPPAAVEISAQGILAAASPGAGQPPVFAFEQLPPGVLVAEIAEANLRSPDVVAEAVRTALDQVSPRTRSVSVVLPDTVVRVFVLDFDSLPARPDEAIPVIRFRLRKMVPFEVEHAGVSYQILSESKNECKILAAVVPGPILQEYEAAIQKAGYEPGAVLPSSLAALAAVDSEEPVLAANLGEMALTTSITNGHDLLLYRTLDLPLDANQRRVEVQRGIAVAAAFYEDKLGARPQMLHFAGIGAAIGTSSDNVAEEFSRWIDDPELAVHDLAPRPETGAATPLGNLVSLAGVVGALAGAA